MLRIIRPNGDVTINLAERPGRAFGYGEYDQEMSPSLNMPADKARTLSLLTDDLRVVPNVIASSSVVRTRAEWLEPHPTSILVCTIASRCRFLLIKSDP